MADTSKHPMMATISEEDAYAIGVEAFIYLYPLALMDTTRRQAVNVEAGKVFGRGPMNTFTHVRAFPFSRSLNAPLLETFFSPFRLEALKSRLSEREFEKLDTALSDSVEYLYAKGIERDAWRDPEPFLDYLDASAASDASPTHEFVRQVAHAADPRPQASTPSILALQVAAS